MKDLEDNDSAKESAAQLPCDSGLSGVRGLANVKVSKYYPRGSVLFVEGQRPHGVYVLCEGRAKVSIASAEGRTFVLRVAEPGDLLGLNSVLTDRPSEATVETLERSRIDFVSREDLLKLLARDRKACLGVAHALGNKLTGVMGHARLLLLSQSAPEKLARLLIRWSDKHGKRTAQGIRINSSLTHEEIAQMICASRETVTRVLGEFKRKHIVSLIDNAIFVRNRKALEAVARY
ncbi:MAG TPA: Crp/Fnr family transcriptional regulator [Pyrinomonadaceae bacterium]